MASLQSHHSRLNLYREYVPSPHFPSAFGWKSRGNGHILTAAGAVPSSPSEPASLIVVGDVLPTKFWVDKLGGWKEEFGSMKNAKFSLLLGEPQDISFRADWVNAIGRINGATSQIAPQPNDFRMAQSTCCHHAPSPTILRTFLLVYNLLASYRGSLMPSNRQPKYQKNASDPNNKNHKGGRRKRGRKARKYPKKPVYQTRTDSEDEQYHYDYCGYYGGDYDLNID
ncbi:hypothetical protein EDD85DRAFT_786253 [Armillaria nabsnona]|nr:hypothetical protein EDD85DRAFT_786253 [Armillaria nabsnona]